MLIGTEGFKLAMQRGFPDAKLFLNETEWYTAKISRLRRAYFLSFLTNPLYFLKSRLFPQKPLKSGLFRTPPHTPRGGIRVT